LPASFNQIDRYLENSYTDKKLVSVEQGIQTAIAQYYNFIKESKLL